MKPKLITNKTTEQVSGEYLSAEARKNYIGGVAKNKP